MGLGKLARGNPSAASDTRSADAAEEGEGPDEVIAETRGAVTELRLGFERWSAERSGTAPGGDPGSGEAARREAWAHWIEESLAFIDRNLVRLSGQASSDGPGPVGDPQRQARVGELAELAARAGQGAGTLSQEVAQLQRTWDRLGERLRSLMARAIEARDRAALQVEQLECGDASVDADSARGPGGIATEGDEEVDRGGTTV
jgi:hypothetical protein